MIGTVFTQDNDDMRTLINSKSVLQNLSHKLTHDLNSVSFFDKLVYNIYNFDTLEHIQAYHFKKDFKSMHETLHLFYRGLQSHPHTGSRSSEEMLKPCSIFPDHIGERIIILLSHLPLMELFEAKLRYQEMASQSIDGEAALKAAKKRQEEALFGDKENFGPIPIDDRFIDHELKGKYISLLKEKYDDVGKEKLESGFRHLLHLYQGTEATKTTKIAIGTAYWDSKQSLRAENAKKFKEMITSLASSLDANRKNKLNALSFILKNEFEVILNSEVTSIEISKEHGSGSENKYLIKFSTDSELPASELTKLSSVSIIQRECECSAIKIVEKNGKNYTLSCNIEF